MVYNSRMEMLQFQCCFCGEGIGDSQGKFHSLDPCAVIVLGNWQQASPKQVEQQFFCHLERFKHKVENHAPVELEDLASETM